MEVLNTINYTSVIHGIAPNSVNTYTHFLQPKLILSKIYTVLYMKYFSKIKF